MRRFLLPCSMGTVGRISSGLSETLIERVADVALKERRDLILVPRETPFNQIHLENLLRLSKAGAHIIPAMPAFYQKPGFPVAEHGPFPADLLQNDTRGQFFFFHHPLTVDQKETVFGSFRVHQDRNPDFRKAISQRLRHLPETDGFGLDRIHPGRAPGLVLLGGLGT